jgi:23S rRNA pseudouridine2605 synthase
MKKNRPAASKGFSPFKEGKGSTVKRTDSGDRKRETGDRPARPARTTKRDDDNKSFRNRDDDNKGFKKRADDNGSFSDRKDKRPTGTGKRDDGNKSFRKREDDSKGFKKRDDDNSSFHGDFSDKKDKRPARETPSGFNRQKFFDRTNERFADKQARKTDRKKFKQDKQNAAPKAARSRHSSAAADESEGMPLNKYIAHSGLCSRRKAVDLVKEGKVTVNDKPVLEPAFKVTAKDTVTVANKRISLQKNLVYILLNKPKGFITTTDDPEGRQTVMELIGDATSERVFPVGRLDRNTSGLLLLTNDGELAQKLAHPKHNIKKIYHVGLDKAVTKADFEQILAGVTLEDGIALVDALGYVDPKDRTQLGIEIHSGKNRIVRRIFEHLGYNVEKLDRVMYAGLTKKNVNRGKWRLLSEKEVILLKHFK